MANNDVNLDQLYQVLGNYDHAMMTTIASDGSLRARPMSLRLDERLPDADLWFASTMDTSKGREVEANPNIGLGFFKSAKEGYVSISGTVKIDRDRERISQLWRDDWAMWFPQGPDDPDLAILLVTVERADIQTPEQHEQVIADAKEQAATGEDNDAEKNVTQVK